MPIAKTTLSYIDWLLPGHGISLPSCGEFKSAGCPNVEGHAQSLAGVNHPGKVYVKRYKHSCGKAECPICYEKWASKEAHAATRRIEAWTRGRPIHVIASPSQALVDTLSFVKLKKVVRGALKAAGVIGGVLIFHPWREKCRHCGGGIEHGQCAKCRRRGPGDWILSPHFHTVCYGWVRNTKEVSEEHHVIVKNLGVRDSVYRTLMYQLSHCGVHMVRPKKASVTWYGELSYNKLKIKKLKPSLGECPLCGAELVRLVYQGDSDPPSKEGDYWLEPSDWRVVEEVNPWVS